MKKNIHFSGRLWRFLSALVLLFFSWWYHSWITLAVALFVFYEAFAGWCIVHQILGSSSCPLDPKK